MIVIDSRKGSGELYPLFPPGLSEVATLDLEKCRPNPELEGEVLSGDLYVDPEVWE